MAGGVVVMAGDSLPWSEGQVLADLAADVGAVVADAEAERRELLGGLADQHQLSSQGLRNYQSWARQVNRSAEQLLRQGVDEGLVRPDIDIPIAVNLLNSALTSIARWYHPTDRLKPDQIHDQVMKGPARPAASAARGHSTQLIRTPTGSSTKSPAGRLALLETGFDFRSVVLRVSAGFSAYETRLVTPS
jgi:hypothetical protein